MKVAVEVVVEVVAVAARHLHGGVRRFRRPRGEVVAEEGGEEESIVRVEEEPVVRARLRVGGGGGEEALVVEDERKVQRLFGVFAALGGRGVEELGRCALELLREEQHREDVDRITARPVLFMHLLLKLLEGIRGAGRRAAAAGQAWRASPSRHPIAASVLERRGATGSLYHISPRW